MTSVPRFAHPPGRTRPFALGIALLLVATLLVSTAPAQGVLGGVRSDVRNPPPPSPPAPASPPKRDDRDDDHHHHSHSDYHDDCDDGTAELYLLGGVLAVVTVTSPLWLPRHLMQDDCGLVGLEGRFPGFPYDDVPGFMVIDSRLNVPVQWPLEFNPDTHLPTRSEFDLLKNWSGRFRLEYADTFDGVERLGGHLLIETTSRFGMDMSLDYFEETLLDGSVDDLSMGDVNFVYRFAQCEHAQMRTGIGLNWLDDSLDTDFGFNFTYGGDFFPVRPWIFSADLDWGTIGHAELFRFRATTGVIVNRLETYVGYEYLDIGQTQVNSLIAGVRVWF